MKFDLVRPCPHCPFRTDIDGYLRPERAQEIATSIARGATFPCHKTTEYVEDEEGNDLKETATSQMCAGAMIAMEREEHPNQALRFAERIGLYDPSKLDMSSPVGTLFEFQRKHDDREESNEPCCVSDMGCEAPAGYMESGMIIDNVIEFELPKCESCWANCCENCGGMVSVNGDDKFLCAMCQESIEEFGEF